MRDRRAPIQGVAHNRVRAQPCASESRSGRTSRNGNDVEAPVSGGDIPLNPQICSSDELLNISSTKRNCANSQNEKPCDGRRNETLTATRHIFQNMQARHYPKAVLTIGIEFIDVLPGEALFQDVLLAIIAIDRELPCASTDRAATNPSQRGSCSIAPTGQSRSADFQSAQCNSFHGNGQ
jgi:hypothetical protein